MTQWTLIYTKQANKDAKKISQTGLKSKVEKLLFILEKNPLENPPEYEKLVGDLTGAYSRRINLQLRLIYQIVKAEKIVKVIRLWTHYE